ncbi:MAG: hypothetical protein ACK4PR_09415, partial [Gammaproteobacteria bacterium]
DVILNLFCTEELKFSILPAIKPEKNIDYFARGQEQRRENEKQSMTTGVVAKTPDNRNVRSLFYNIAMLKYNRQEHPVIPLLVSFDRSENEDSQFEGNGQDLLREIGQFHLLLLGKSGIGKSVLCHDLLMSIIHLGKNPIYLENKMGFYQDHTDLLQSGNDIWVYINAYICNHYQREMHEAKVTSETLLNFLRDNKSQMICIFDGFSFKKKSNESNELQHELLKQAIIEQVHIDSGAAQFIISSQDMVTGFDEIGSFQIRELLGFSDCAINLFLQNSGLSSIARESLDIIPKSITRIPQNLQSICKYLKEQKNKKSIFESKYGLYSVIIKTKIASVCQSRQSSKDCGCLKECSEGLYQFIQEDIDYDQSSTNLVVVRDPNNLSNQAEMLKDAGIFVKKDEDSLYAFSHDIIRFFLQSCSIINVIKRNANLKQPDNEVYTRVKNKLLSLTFPPAVLIFTIQHFLEEKPRDETFLTEVEQRKKNFIFEVIEALSAAEKIDLIFQCLERSDVLDINKDFFSKNLFNKLDSYISQKFVQYNDLETFQQCISGMLYENGMLNYLKARKKLLNSFLNILQIGLKSIRYIANGKAFMFIFNNLRENIKKDYAKNYSLFFIDAIATHHYAGYYQEAFELLKEFEQDILQHGNTSPRFFLSAKDRASDICRQYYVLSAAARTVYDFDKSIYYLKEAFFHAKQLNMTHDYTTYGVVIYNIGLQKLAFYCALKNSPNSDKVDFINILLDAISDLYEALHRLDLKKDSVYLLRVSVNILDIANLLGYYDKNDTLASRLVLYKKVANSLIGFSQNEEPIEWDGYKKTVKQKQLLSTKNKINKL